MRRDRQQRRAAIFCNPKNSRETEVGVAVLRFCREAGPPDIHRGVSSLDLRPGRVSPTGHFPRVLLFLSDNSVKLAAA